MSDGAVLKAEKDFTKDVDKLLPEAQELAHVRSMAFLRKIILMLLCRLMFKAR